MTESRLSYLFYAYFSKIATQQERDELMELLGKPENDELVKTLLEDTWHQFQGGDQLFNENQRSEMLANIMVKVSAGKPDPIITAFKIPYSWMRISIAAAVLFFIIAGAYFWQNTKNPIRPIAQSKNIINPAKVVILPGSNKAVLRLADGSEILLDSSQQGTLAKQGNSTIKKINNSTLAYEPGDENNDQVVYNTLFIPTGGQYQLILPDGTRVWLNASSSIHFPTVFKGKERNVTVTGEAYFEVAKNKAMPFKINVKDMLVQVLGTHFNIMAYDDEVSLNTTLLEGSLKVSKGSLNKLLLPGEQSRISKTGDINVVKADIEEVMAWKKGWFQFNAYDLKTVMRQISRWYNVQVEYEGKIPEGHFSGLVRRDNDITQVLKIIQEGGVRFKIEGRKVVVLN